MSEEELAFKKRSAAIKLAKELNPFDMDLGYEFLPVYIETLTEDMRQIARDNRKLAKELDIRAKKDGVELYTIVIDEEPETISKLMRRYSTRINKSCVLLYETAYIDFESHELSKLDSILEEDDYDGSEDD